MKSYPLDLILYFIKSRDKKAMSEKNLILFNDIKEILKHGDESKKKKIVNIFNEYCTVVPHEYRDKPDKTYYRLGFKAETPKETFKEIKNIHFEVTNKKSIKNNDKLELNM